MVSVSMTIDVPDMIGVDLERDHIGNVKMTNALLPQILKEHTHLLYILMH
jgi:hypothetical protein